MKCHRWFRANWDLYLLALLPILYILLFKYGPMYGAQIAFRQFSAVKGILGSPWVGLDNFIRFFNSYNFWIVLRNTVTIGLYDLAVTFPAPIVFALGLHYTRNQPFRKTVQMVAYAPHFISVVVVSSMILQFLGPRYGIVNVVVQALGSDAVNFMGRPEYFKTIFVLSNVWQHTGWASIIYLAGLSAIEPELHEAAIVDGATRLQRVVHIDIPGILSLAVVLLILQVGQIMNIQFEKILLLQNPVNLTQSEVIQTYVYKIGLASQLPDFSYASAIGLFSSVVGLLLLLLVNYVANRVNDSGLW